MRNSWLVVKYEVITTLSKPSFWLMAFLFPLFILAVSVVPALLVEDSAPSPMGMDFASESAVSDVTPIGYIDEAGLIESLPAGFPPDLLRPFTDEAAAKTALNAGEIEEYYIIPTDYVTAGQLVLVSQEMEFFSVASSEAMLEYVLNLNLLGDEGKTAVIANPALYDSGQSLMETAVVDESDEDTAGGFAFAVPFGAMFIFFFLITMSSGYMLQSVSREKENRTAEVLLLSLEPRQLMLGKMIGLSAVALLQMGIWAGAALLVLNRDSDLAATLSDTGLSASFFIWALLYFVLGYLMYASLMGAIGALVPSAREGGQFTFFVLLPLLIPIWLNYLFINAPNSGLAVGMSLFPLTAPVAMITRMVATDVPLWQLVASLLTQAVTAYLFVLLAAYFFRADTLLSNTAVSWRRVFSRTKQAA